MRIAFIVNEVTPRGGIGRVVLNLAKNLKEQGHKIQILTINYNSNFTGLYGIEEKEIICYKKLMILNELRKIPIFGFLLQIIKFQILGLLLSRQLIKSKPDIINSHHYLCGISGWIVSRMIKRPHICSLHGIHLSKLIMNSIYYWVDYVILKFLKNHVSHFISVDPVIKSHNPFKTISDKIEIIFPCIDGKYLELLEGDKPKTKNKGGFHLIYMGRLEKQKGLGELFRRLKEDVLCWSELKVVGSGNYEDQLKELASKLNISDKIVFKGFLDGQAKVQVMKDSDIFISYSRSEGFPLTILEFFSLGKPCIIYPVGGISYFQNRIENEKLGIFLKPKPNFLREILTSPDISTLFLESVCEARRNFVRDFYPKLITQRYIKFFKKIAVTEIS
jgi:glycosyltransferase involved in cell wall biosynthesis